MNKKVKDGLKARIKREASIVVTVMPEDIPLRGNCLASGDAAEDEACAVELERQLESGNEWAWCQVKVEAFWNGLRGVDYLGACSYASEADFKAQGGYYDDMVSAALDQVEEQARGIAAVVK